MGLNHAEDLLLIQCVLGVPAVGYLVLELKLVGFCARDVEVPPTLGFDGETVDEAMTVQVTHDCLCSQTKYEFCVDQLNTEIL